MPKNRDYIFVLWGDQFEEAVATIFVTELRARGLRVKVVGLTPLPIGGRHGLVLTPDLTLDQALALAGHTICIIIPYRSHCPKRLDNDPRWREFLKRAQANQARLVIGWSSETDGMVSELFADTGQVVNYPGNEDLVEFAQELAGWLPKAIGQ